MVLKDCSRCMVYTPQGKRLPETRVIHTGGSVSLFSADCGLKDVRFRSRIDFYDKQTGLVITVCELVLYRNPSYPDMPEPWMTKCRVQDVLEVVQRQKDIQAKVHIEARCSSTEHGTSYIVIGDTSAGDIYVATAQPLNKNKAVTFTYRFRTLGRRFEAATLWVKRVEGGRYSYRCRLVNLTDRAEATIRSFVLKELLERQQEKERG